MFVFRKIWRALFSWNTRSEIRPFALLPTIYGFLKYLSRVFFTIIVFITMGSYLALVNTNVTNLQKVLEVPLILETSDPNCAFIVFNANLYEMN